MGRHSKHARRAPLLLVLLSGLLTGCGEADRADDEITPVKAEEIARIIPAAEALSGAHIPTLDPMTMTDAEIRKALGTGPRCVFRYTSAGRPVLALGLAESGELSDGLAKLNGSLIQLQLGPAEGNVDKLGGVRLVADPVRLTLQPDPGEAPELQDGMQRREANLVFEIAQSVRVGYRGYVDCLPESTEEAQA
ncbi:hypothetical protein [Indioceanicola profundi]|uniref:hypothetical protein n=1 Tax=Indioceanicola profundi TaxID=2220096 RepID=UPI000E6AC206|nr:hypothetical protein [Indioceanicola profundi]